jgi:tetratricopeptide (TPR) repeat protein
LEAATEAIRLAPYHAGAHKNLAFAYHAQGELSLALAAARESVRLYPKYDLAHYILGVCYAEDGQDDEAIAEIETFLDLFWDRAYVRDYAARAETLLEELK